MTRKSREELLFDGCFAHILSRSFERRSVLKERQDFEVFQTFLLESKKASGFLLHHYCLMNTHFHLLVTIPRLGPFSKALQGLKWRYTAYYNKKHHRTGPLWRERFTSRVIEDEKYLYACGLYIEANPVKAGMVEAPEDWPYSSSGYYLLGKADALIDSYEREGLPEEMGARDESFFTKGRVVGSELFKMQVAEGAFH